MILLKGVEDTVRAATSSVKCESAARLSTLPAFRAKLGDDKGSSSSLQELPGLGQPRKSELSQFYHFLRTSSSDKSEIRQRNVQVDTDLPSNSPQDRGSEPSKRVDRKKGKKGDGKNGDGNKERLRVDVSQPDLKHHPLARSPPRRAYY